ncbi:MAG: carotenoid biosynthesis protein [Bacteroidia bacterium]|nr:carotenoid biosynthesis protein [Bacteroidia bacterium]
MERSKRSVVIATIILVVFHQVGVIGFHLPDTRAMFETLVPFNLLLSVIILLIFHKEWSIPFGVFAFISFWIGYGIEVVGVQTGIVFGAYHYETALGFKIAGVPPIIGLNWFMLVYCSNIISQKLSNNIFIKATIGALLVLLLDFFIEPMAIAYNFWEWDNEGGIIPTQNYLAWLLISWLLSFGFHTISTKKENAIAPALYVVQLLFFASFMVIDGVQG